MHLAQPAPERDPRQPPFERCPSAPITSVRSLLENGVRRICVSLQGALQNPAHEQRIKQVIDDQYPDHFLGSVPVLTGSE